MAVVQMKNRQNSRVTMLSVERMVRQAIATGDGLHPDATEGQIKRAESVLSRGPGTPQTASGETQPSGNLLLDNKLDLALLNQDIPPIDWLVEGRIQSGAPSYVVSKGGIGKSTFMLMTAIALAIGRTLHPSMPVTRSRSVGIMQMEDPAIETLRRTKAIVDWCVITPEERKLMGGNLHIYDLCGRAQPILKKERGSTVVREEVIQMITKAVKADNLELLVFDTQSRGFGGDENSSSDGTMFTNAVEQTVRDTGCAIIILHHTGKTANADGMYSGRGSSAFADNFRGVLTMTRTEKSSKDKPSPFAANEEAEELILVRSEKISYSAPVKPFYLRRDGMILEEVDPVATRQLFAGEDLIGMLRGQEKELTVRMLCDREEGAAIRVSLGLGPKDIQALCNRLVAEGSLKLTSRSGHEYISVPEIHEGHEGLWD